MAQADQPPTDPPTVIYNPWDPDRVILPVGQLRAVAEHYATTGQRPTGVQWAPVQWI